MKNAKVKIGAAGHLPGVYRCNASAGIMVKGVFKTLNQKIVLNEADLKREEIQGLLRDRLLILSKAFKRDIASDEVLGSPVELVKPEENKTASSPLKRFSKSKHKKGEES